jgi:hypothetical protein
MAIGIVFAVVAAILIIRGCSKDSGLLLAAASRQRALHPAPQSCVRVWNEHPPPSDEMNIVGGAAAASRIPLAYGGPTPVAIRVYQSSGASASPSDSDCVVVLSTGTPPEQKIAECSASDRAGYSECAVGGRYRLTPANATADGAGHLCWDYVQITVKDSCASGEPRQLPNGQNGS